jgi:hypothetical protein
MDNVRARCSSVGARSLASGIPEARSLLII